MSKHPQVDFLVAYCSLQGAQPALDTGFGREIVWDIPLLDGYPWLYAPNRSPRSKKGGFLEYVNPELAYLIYSRRFDAVIISTSYLFASFWIAMVTTKLCGAALLMVTDAHNLQSQSRKLWKQGLKTLLWPFFFRLADAVIVPSSGGLALMQSVGIPVGRVFLAPYVVNNDWWIEQARQVKRSEIRAAW
jgi:hypothetical protein